MNALPQVLGPSHDLPEIRAEPGVAALRRDNNAVVWVERLANEVLAHEGPIRARPLDEAQQWPSTWRVGLPGSRAR